MYIELHDDDGVVDFPIPTETQSYLYVVDLLWHCREIFIWILPRLNNTSTSTFPANRSHNNSGWFKHSGRINEREIFNKTGTCAIAVHRRPKRSRGIRPRRRGDGRDWINKKIHLGAVRSDVNLYEVVNSQSYSTFPFYEEFVWVDPVNKV